MLKKKQNEKQIYVFDNESEKYRFLNEKKYNTLYDVSYSIFADGFRTTKCSKLGEEAYIFLGCSFVFGEGLNDNETLPYYFSKLMNFKVNVLNLGVIGKGINLTINILNNNVIYKYVNKETKKYFIYSLIDSHVIRSFDFDARSINDNWIYKNNKWFETSSIQPFGYTALFFARSFIFRKIFLKIINEKNRNFHEEYLIENFKKIDNIIEKKYDAELIIIVWPCVEQKIIEDLTAAKFDLVILPRYLMYNKYKIKDDIHPSAQANEKIANMLYEHINSQQKKIVLN